MGVRASLATSLAPPVALAASATDALESMADIANRGTSTESVLIKPIPIRNPVSGPDSAIDGNVALFDGTSGRVIKDGLYSIADIIAAASAGASTAVHELIISSTASNPLVLQDDIVQNSDGTDLVYSS